MVDKSTQEVLPNSSKIKDPEGWTTGVTLLWVAIRTLALLQQATLFRYSWVWEVSLFLLCARLYWSQSPASLSGFYWFLFWIGCSGRCTC